MQDHTNTAQNDHFSRHKTSGAKGVHVVVPIKTSAAIDDVAARLARRAGAVPHGLG